MIRPKQLARIGEFHLREAVLDVLFEAHPKGIGPSKISKQAGIYRDGGKNNDKMKDAITAGILNQLEEQDKVKHIKKDRVWKLSEDEYKCRCDDLGDYGK